MEHFTIVSTITAREKQILRLVVSEHSTIEISSILRISVRTVETHRKNILRKTNSRSLVGLTKHAIQLGLLDGYFYQPAGDLKIRGKSNRFKHGKTALPPKNLAL